MKMTLVRTPLVIAAALSVVLGVGGLSPLSASATTPPGTAAQVSVLVTASVKITVADSAVLAELPNASYDTADFALKIPALCELATDCDYGDTNSSTSIVLFGNSHARMWLPAIIPAATVDGVRIVLLGKNSCPVVTMTLNATKFPGCSAVTSAVTKTINALKPKTVILADRTVSTGYSAATWQKGMAATFKALEPSKAKMVVIGDIQEFNSPPPTCLAAHPTTIQKSCSVANPNPKEKGLESAEQAAAKAAKALYVNPSPWLCTAKVCSPVIGDMIGYWGADHVSVTYATYLSTVMGLALKSVL